MKPILERLSDLERAIRCLNKRLVHGKLAIDYENGDVEAFVRVCERIDNERADAYNHLDEFGPVCPRSGD